MGVLLAKPKNVNMAAVAQTVKDLIASDTVVIFSKSYCPYCKMAKEVSNYFFINLIVHVN